MLPLSAFNARSILKCVNDGRCLDEYESLYIQNDEHALNADNGNYENLSPSITLNRSSSIGGAAYGIPETELFSAVLCFAYHEHIHCLFQHFYNHPTVDDSK